MSASNREGRCPLVSISDPEFDEKKLGTLCTRFQLLSSGPFSLAGANVFEQALRDAGFREVSVQALPIQLHFASIDAFFQQMPSASTANVMKQLDQQDQQRLQGEIRQALS